jgi:hypothetical protein
MIRRPSQSVDVLLTDLGVLVEQNRRQVDTLREEVEVLRRERITLIAQLDFALDRANLETLHAASLEEALDAERKERRAAHDTREILLGRQDITIVDEGDIESTAVLPARWLRSVP